MCEQLDLFSASSRMSKDTSTGDSNQSSKTWKAQVNIQRGEYSQRKKLAHLTKGNASSFLPTPTATPWKQSGGAAGRTGQVRHSLESMAKHDLWPTPTLHGNYNRKGASQNSGDGLETAVKKELWPTPTATERSGTNPKDWEGAWTEQGREELANPDSSLRLNVRQQISEQGKKTQQRIGDSSGSTSEELANTINEGSQGGLQREAGFAMER